jgi:hypothetical protein
MEFKNYLISIRGYVKASYLSLRTILAAGSSLAIWTIVYGIGQDIGLPYWLSLFAGWLASNVWYNAIEMFLSKIMLVSFAFLLGDRQDRAAMKRVERRAGRFSVIVTAVLVTATGALSLLVNPEVATAVTKKEDTSQQTVAASAVVSSYDKDVAILQKQLEDAKAQDASTLSEAKAEKVKLIAEVNLGAEMKRFVSIGNGWAIGETKKATAKAAAKGDALMAAAQANAQAPAAQKALNEYLAANAGKKSEVVAKATDVTVNAQQTYLSTINSRVGMLKWVVLISLVLYVIVACFLSLIYMATDHEDDDTEGVIHAINKVVKTGAEYVARLITGKADNRLKMAIARLPTGAQSTTDNIADSSNNRHVTGDADSARSLSDNSFTADNGQPTGKHTMTLTVTDRSEPTTDSRQPTTSQPTADNDSDYTSASPSDVQRAIERARKYYERSFTSAKEETRALNKASYNDEKKALEAIGYRFALGANTSKIVRVGGKAKQISFKKLTIAEN